MMRLVALELLLVASTATAGPAAAAVEADTRSAIRVAMDGNCEAAQKIAARVKELDADHHDRVLARDPAMVACARGETAPERRSLGKDGGWPARRLLGELVAGGALGLGLGVGSAVVACAAVCGHDTVFIGLPVGLGLAAMVVGTAVGVYAVGELGDDTGSFGATLGGSVLGTGLGAAFGLSTRSAGGLAATSIAGALVGSIIGFNATRRRERPTWAPAASVSAERSTFGIAGSF